MKIIIIEGPDNIGKSTLINYILDNYNTVKVIHCNKPISENPFLEQCNSFGKYVLQTIYDYNNNTDIDCIVFNRFYQGEYVYGQLYRNENKDSIIEMIHILESKLINNIKQKDLIYIQMNSSSPELLIKNDDGKSLSNAKLENIKQEIKLFNNVYKISNIKNKHSIKVNVNSSPIFRDKECIISNFKKYIK